MYNVLIMYLKHCYWSLSWWRCSKNGNHPICEVEFELKQGAVKTLIHSNGLIVMSYGSMLEVKPKFTRIRKSRFTCCSRKKLDKNISAEQALKKIVENCFSYRIWLQLPITSPKLSICTCELTSFTQCNSSFFSMDLNPAWEEQIAALFRKLGVT